MTAKPLIVMTGGGAAIVVPNAELTGPRLCAEVLSLLRDTERMTSMSRAVSDFAPGQATQALADLVVEQIPNAPLSAGAYRA